MIAGGYTSPSDQAMDSMEIAISIGTCYGEAELALIGEATRLVMEAALDNPEASPETWIVGVREYLGSPAVVRPSRLLKKAGHAHMLLDCDLLITDEALASMVIDNDFIRPARQTH